MHIQNCAIFRILAYLELQIYPELCQITFWHIQKIVERLHIKNPAIFRNFPYNDLHVDQFERFEEGIACMNYEQLSCMVLMREDRG